MINVSPKLVKIARSGLLVAARGFQADGVQTKPAQGRKMPWTCEYAAIQTANSFCV
jgi:hypothetical protein